MKYELDKERLFLLRTMLRHTLRYIFLSSAGKVHSTLGCSRLGILFENPLKLHTNCLPRVWTTPVVVGFLIIGNLGLCRFLPATLGCYSLMKSVISVGVDNVQKGWVLYM